MELIKRTLLAMWEQGTQSTFRCSHCIAEWYLSEDEGTTQYRIAEIAEHLRFSHSSPADLLEINPRVLVKWRGHTPGTEGASRYGEGEYIEGDAPKHDNSENLSRDLTGSPGSIRLGRLIEGVR